MIRILLVCILGAGSASVAAAAERHRARAPLVEQHRAVGRAVPIVAGSSTIKVDAVGQVVTNFNPGKLDDDGRATGKPN